MGSRAQFAISISFSDSTIPILSVFTDIQKGVIYLHACIAPDRGYQIWRYEFLFPFNRMKGGMEERAHHI